MKRRILSILLICSVLLSLLSACGESAEPEPTRPQSGRTLFIYMCGSNLESKQGRASKNITELLGASVGDDLNIVIQTGGAKLWRSHGIEASAVQRYEVKNGELRLIETLGQMNMSHPDTLADFLRWGQEHYPTENNMLILWDHGGGAVKGLCYDENYGFDAMTLTELHKALESAQLKQKFELIGFDTCLMASIETAVTVRDYARYMVASEEIEPSGGWNFRALAEACSAETDPVMVGKLICESFMEKCKANGTDSNAMLSLFDLSLTDKMLKEFERVVGIIELGLRDKHLSAEMIYGLKMCEKFGVSNNNTGSANMLDLLDIFNHTPNIGTEDTGGNLTDFYQIVHDFVMYNVGGDRRFTYGLSFYYPLDYDEKEVRDYIALGISETYNRFLDRFYLHIPETTVRYTDAGKITDSGAFAVTFEHENINYLASVDYILMHTDGDGVRHILCTDNDISSNLAGFVYQSNFKGTGHALEGHRMFYVATYRTDEYGVEQVEYSAPIIVNGQRTTMHYDYYRDHSEEGYGSFLIYGLWSGYDENGMPVFDYSDFNEGDRVQVVTDVVEVDGEIKETLSEEFIMGNDGEKITVVPLEEKTYQYVFVASDLFDNTFMSDVATFEMTVSPEELAQKPLPDEQFAAKVVKIESSENM